MRKVVSEVGIGSSVLIKPLICVCIYIFTVSGLSSMILVNKRRAMELFPESVTKLWNEWELRALVLLSLFLQIVLILLGNRRKYIASNWVRIIIWLAYLAADWIAAVCIGVLSNENGDDNLSQPNSLIWAFWAPFLLLHLGGPDTITAYSLEDNELWLRHFLALVIQFGGTFYIFLRSWKAKLLNILAIPIFVAGLIKYGERTWVLRSASSEQFRDALLPRPDPGPNYPKFMDEYTSGKAEGYQVSIQQRGKTSRTVHSPPEGDILRQAYYFFETFKGLFADIILSSQRRKRSHGGQVKTKTKTQRATDLCYENDAEKNPDCKACKVLSDYMLYLLVMCPFMLPDGIGEIRYRDSCAEAKEFFKDRKHIKSRTQACKDLLRWELMRGVWVEMLCYAASQCRPNQHAKQLRRGGELLTHVWLLMAHLDVRENFQISQGNAKGGIIDICFRFNSNVNNTYISGNPPPIIGGCIMIDFTLDLLKVLYSYIILLINGSCK
ncbi:unnamed protein product, partial [Vitis vinifera]